MKGKFWVSWFFSFIGNRVGTYGLGDRRNRQLQGIGLMKITTPLPLFSIYLKYNARVPVLTMQFEGKQPYLYHPVLTNKVIKKILHNTV